MTQSHRRVVASLSSSVLVLTIQCSTLTRTRGLRFRLTTPAAPAPHGSRRPSLDAGPHTCYLLHTATRLGPVAWTLTLASAWASMPTCETIEDQPTDLGDGHQAPPIAVAFHPLILPKVRFFVWWLFSLSLSALPPDHPPLPTPASSFSLWHSIAPSTPIMAVHGAVSGPRRFRWRMWEPLRGSAGARAPAILKDSSRCRSQCLLAPLPPLPPLPTTQHERHQTSSVITRSI